MLGTALCSSRTKVLLLGAGELGKEVAIEFQRFGVEVVAVDRYPNAPAMHVAHKSAVIDMLDATALQHLVDAEKPDYIVPEIEAIATDQLVKIEQQGITVVPSARATQLTMDREGIRRLVAEELSLPTSPFCFAESEQEYLQATDQIGYPFVVKPVMSSSGKGQSVVKSANERQAAWAYAQDGGRAGAGRVIVEGFVAFDYEITLLTVSAADGIHFCAPIGHRQEDGDYRESWQPQKMSADVLAKAQNIASKVVKSLGGYGVFGVELFVQGQEVFFNEVSPRPHDTGLVTLVSQNLSEFALHVRAIMGLPIGSIEQYSPSASSVMLGDGNSQNIRFSGLEQALSGQNVQLRLFGKPDIGGRRRLGVVMSKADTLDGAVDSAKLAASQITVHY